MFTGLSLVLQREPLVLEFFLGGSRCLMGQGFEAVYWVFERSGMMLSFGGSRCGGVELLLCKGLKWEL